MSDQSIVVMAIFKAKKGKEAALEKELAALLEPSRKEKGCLLYNLHRYSDSPESFVFYEQWEDKEALAQHEKSEHLKNCVQHIKGLLSGHPTVRLLELL